MSSSALGTGFVIQAALKLPVADRIEVLHRLWDSLPADSEAARLSPEMLAEIERRVAYDDAHPEEDIPWDEVKARATRQP